MRIGLERERRRERAQAVVQRGPRAADVRDARATRVLRRVAPEPDDRQDERHDGRREHR
jgi:hypothetical protein